MLLENVTWLIIVLYTTSVLGLHSKSLKTWPDATVYFDIDPTLPKGTQEAIKYAVHYMNSHTCVQWEQRYPWRDDFPNYVTFNYYNDTWAKPVCRSDIGLNGGQQEVRLGRNCWRQRYGKVPEQRKTVLHEMMHSLGFKHEHQRPDRDCYITVTAPKPLYEIVPNPNEWVDDFPYDYTSVTHYVLNLEAKNKSITKIGRYDGTISPTDIKKIQSVYCGAPSFCGDQRNVLTCRDIWAAKVDSNCSDWSGWIKPS